MISREHLLQLDKLIDAEWQKLSEYHESFVANKVEAELSEIAARFTKDERSNFDRKSNKKRLHEQFSNVFAYKKRRTLVIHLTNERRAASSSFEEALRDPALLNEKPVGFTVTLNAADIECILEVPYYRDWLRLKVAPDKDALAKGLFSALRSWVDQVKPAYWKTFWLRLQGGWGQWFLWTTTLLIALMYFTLFAPDASSVARAARHSEAIGLLKTGVSATNQFKALELILSYESGFVPRDRTILIPAWFWWTVYGGPIFCIALGFVPNVILGIGRGEESIRNWNKWMTLVGVTFPLWIIGNFAWPRIQKWLANLF